MIAPTPVRTFKRILVILTACLLQLSATFVFAADLGLDASPAPCENGNAGFTVTVQ